MKINAYIANAMSSGVYPPIFHKYRKWGIYVLTFFKNFSWRYIIIDERLPIYKYKSEPVFAKCSDLGELWVPFIEKAFAKLYGSYNVLVSGFLDDGVVDMTGMVCEKVTFRNDDGVFTTLDGDVDKFWDYLKDLKGSGSLMGCSISGKGTETQVRDDYGEPVGLLAGHAYSINDVFTIVKELTPEEVARGKKPYHRLLRIRNPWGKCEWNGKWSDESEEKTKHNDKLTNYMRELEGDEKFEIGNSEDGMFFINYKNWRTFYNKFFVAVDFDDKWNAVRFEYFWSKSKGTWGDVPRVPSEESFKSFGNNPQFLIKPDHDCELFVSIG